MIIFPQKSPLGYDLLVDLLVVQYSATVQLYSTAVSGWDKQPILDVTIYHLRHPVGTLAGHEVSGFYIVYIHILVRSMARILPIFQ